MGLKEELLKAGRRYLRGMKPDAPKPQPPPKRVKKGKKDIRQCPTCKGYGSVPDPPPSWSCSLCNTCSGSGYVLKEIKAHPTGIGARSCFHCAHFGRNRTPSAEGGMIHWCYLNKRMSNPGSICDQFMKGKL